MTDDTDAAIAGLASMSLAQLRTEWARRQKRPPPPCRSKEVLRGLLAWAIQEKAYGGLHAETRRRLRELKVGVAYDGAAPRHPATQLMPGTVLTREWRGTLHRVCVLEGGFSYDGKSFDDLSSIARTITGTRWSGPRFFGLKRGNENL